MIRDVTELREVGQVCRRVAELDIDVDTWRAGMRRAARREGMRIRTFVVEATPPADTDSTHTFTDAGSDTGEVLDGLVDDLAVAGELEDGAAAGPVVYAVRTDLPPDLDKMMTAMNQLAADRLGPTIEAALRPPAPVTSLTEKRAQRTAQPSAEPDEH